MERRGKAAVRMAANQPPEQKRTLPRRGRPYSPFPKDAEKEQKPKPKPSGSGFGLERRGKGAMRMGAG